MTLPPILGGIGHLVRAELESALTELRAATGLEDPEGSEPGISPPW